MLTRPALTASYDACGQNRSVEPSNSFPPSVHMGNFNCCGAWRTALRLRLGRDRWGKAFLREVLPSHHFKPAGLGDELRLGWLPRRRTGLRHAQRPFRPEETPDCR